MKPFGFFLLASLAVPSMAQSPPEAEVLRKLFEEGTDAVTYTEQFSNALPPGQLAQVLSSIESQLGEFQSVSGTANPFTAVFESGSATVQIVLDNAGRLAGLRFTQLVPQAAGIEEALERFDSLPGTTAYLITENGTVRAAKNQDEPLAIGSAFKLAVLAAVERAVEDGRLAWTQTVEMKDEWRSLPTGILQDWPAGVALTLETLAALMISISDNTATDALIDIVGRTAVEELAPNSVPLLTTAEAFKLKNPDNEALLRSYRSSSVSAKRRVLGRLDDAPLPPPDLFAGDPVAQDVEWFISVSRLCSLIQSVAHLDLMTINPGIANADDWARVAYKGGSEPGIMNMTIHLEHPDGTTYCVSATNVRTDGTVDEVAFYSAFQGVLSALR